MDADLLRTLRGLSMYKTVWDRKDAIDLDDPDSRLEFIRVCRDTERFDDALPLIGSEPATDSRALAEQLAVLDLVGDSTQLADVLDAALAILDRTPDGSLPDPFLSCAAARAQASFGHLRGGLAIGRIAPAAARAGSRSHDHRALHLPGRELPLEDSMRGRSAA
jgi:hypothetical protein